MNIAEPADRKIQTLRSRFRPVVIAADVSKLALVLFFGAMVTADGADDCLALEGKRPIINKKDTLLYQGKLFLTPDDVARYVFLTNRRDDGDRSAGVYRARGKRNSLPGDFWVTVTVAADSIANHPNAAVRRFDAPLPASVADALNELWLAVCQQSRTDEDALPSAPTGIFSVMPADGHRLKVVTVSLIDEHSLCRSLLNLSELLIDYAKLPAARRAQAAQGIEKESRRLLSRVSKGGELTIVRKRK